MPQCLSGPQQRWIVGISYRGQHVSNEAVSPYPFDWRAGKHRSESAVVQGAISEPSGARPRHRGRRVARGKWGTRTCSTGRWRDNHRSRRFGCLSPCEIRAELDLCARSSDKKYSASRRVGMVRGRHRSDRHPDSGNRSRSDRPLLRLGSNPWSCKFRLEGARIRAIGRQDLYVCLAIPARCAGRAASP